MPLNEKDRENLVAFLDGELDRETAQALEAKLNLDPQARAEAEALKQIWGLLDYLPKPELSPNFTSRTLEKLSGPISPSGKTKVLAKVARRWPVLFCWAAGVLVTLGLGFGVGGWLLPSPNVPKSDHVDELMVRHLRLIERMYLYEHVDDLDFLKALNDPDLFGEETGS